MKERNEMDPEYMWDLSTLYSGDEAWEADLAGLEADIAAVEGLRGTLKDAGAIRVFYDLDTGLERRLNNVATYAMLRQAENTRQTRGLELMSRANSVVADAVSRTSFARPEILSLPMDELEKIAQSRELEPYRFLIRQLMEEKQHVLSDAQEEVLGALGEVMTASKNIANTLMDADMTFDSVKDGAGEEHALNAANFILLEQSPDRSLRENAFHSYYHGYESHINTLAASYAGIVKSHAVEARLRHFDSSRAMALWGEHIPATVYDSLVDTVRRHLPSMYRYVALRKKILGLNELHYYDVYTPLASDLDVNWTYDEARQMVLEALSPLGEAYVERVRKAYEDKWIDVYPNVGKNSGAFSSGTFDSNPFILMNFTGDYESVSTLAHEMGHSQHTWASKSTQPVQYADYTLFVAEVASTVNENLLVEHLLARTEDPGMELFLLNQYLEGFKGTLFRQTMFAEFEKTAHEMCDQGQALTQEALCRVYGQLIADYFGPDLVMDPEVSLEWARIPHFYRPFYVYKYATSYSASIALTEKILRGDPEDLTSYLNFLTLGGSMYPLDELKMAGVDLTTSYPVEMALQKFDEILTRAEKAYERLMTK